MTEGGHKPSYKTVAVTAPMAPTKVRQMTKVRVGTKQVEVASFLGLGEKKIKDEPIWQEVED